jgi:hypothetical protein
MKFYSKCHTLTQQEARKVLRVNARFLRDLRALDPNCLSTVERRREYAQTRQIAERIAEAFERARTDTELMRAMKLAVSLTSLAVDPVSAMARA